MIKEVDDFSCGEVYLFHKYPYIDGGDPTPKYVIVVGVNDVIITVKTTTDKGKHYKDYPPGCYARSQRFPAYYIEKEEKEGFY
jgi:hypothetical protein